MPDFDKPWFERQLERLGFTNADVAARLPDQPDRTAVVYLFAGYRRMRLDEAVVFARLFDTSLETIAKHAGATGEVIPKRRTASK